MKKVNYLKKVKEQYEDYPYPPRDPEQEKKYLSCTNMDFLDMINFYCFEGKETFNNGFRVLVAGCGTGDSVIFLAEQLRGKNAKVIALDLSKNSLEVAKKRAEIRKLSNIKWYNESLLDLPKLDIGKFDYINCSGVLHHLEDPSKGLLALKSVLKEDGAMGIMLYGKYGRSGVYEVQELLRIINKNEQDINQKIANTKIILDSLPAYHPLKQNLKVLRDVRDFGDVGIYDLLLHSQDIPFTVTDIYNLVEEKAKLKLASFIEGFGVGEEKYEPSSFIKNDILLQKIALLTKREQQSLTELLSYNIEKHYFYLTKQAKKSPSVDDLNKVPYISSSYLSHGMYEDIYNALSNNMPFLNFTFRFPEKCLTLQISVKQYLKDFFKYFNGENTFKEICDLIVADYNNDLSIKPAIINMFKELYSSLKRYDIILLKEKNSYSPVVMAELQKYVSTLYLAETV
jgi:2-polyprenyl-3-methyl-5-hydroxy-6-metoxy-1,4-benzoquinol methylase